MVRRWRLIFWALVEGFHTRLHERMDRRNLEFYTFKDDPDNWDYTDRTYTSPSVHYMGGARPPDGGRPEDRID
jgi:hypothetical protein